MTHPDSARGGDEGATAETGDSRLEEFLGDPETAALDLTSAAARCTRALGIPHSVVYPTDIRQRRLVPLTGITASLRVEDSLAGWAYRTESLRVTDSERGGMTAWLPLVDGAERLGVLAVHVPAPTPAVLRSARALATLIAMMRLPAETLRAFLPPRTIGTAHVVSTTVLEPAYEIGGDAFDHALTETTPHATVLDAGSGLGSAAVDQLRSPAPLVIRDRQLLGDAMLRQPDPPMGLPSLLAGRRRPVHEIAPKPGDRVLMYTDGVTEARAESGGQFGPEQFAGYIIRATATGEPASETLRRLIHPTLDSSPDRPRDDATILMLEWSPPSG
ncbi:hypothetical protein BJ965_000766 [Streptomyces luteogriseus]|uniref:PPM-type phosphatase domain-containing protein n=1 Tax=Streptomyces luteogriseus TaxID=68233 RepID=A0A7W7GF98_9ACTN|nr:SpoIIE family protein phosphatase [Streptomyces luteogriseus]MBB4710884.1 hypothetical protein [Streptomyces luteogriseus]